MGLRVYLGELEVGRLTIEQGAVVFRVEEGYLRHPTRPVLGRMFEDAELSASLAFRGTGSSPHNFFRNYLPEGMLRTLIEQEITRADYQEYRLLEKLGADLPGNLLLVDDQIDLDLEEPPPALPPPAPEGSLRFSLAGIQLKLSVAMEAQDRLTVPVSGLGGRWIAKLPSREYPQLPENECLSLRWAARCGLNVPEHKLYEVSQLANLPKSFGTFEGKLLLIKRFDREDTGRVHQEDFAQVLGLAPELKYAGEVPERVHYSSLGRVIYYVCGKSDFEEYLRRLVFMLLSGNSDAHIKNWSLIYPDGRTPRLSPAYDLVSLIAYPQLKANKLALYLHRAPQDPYAEDPIDPYEITLEHFKRLARFVGVPEDATLSVVTSFAARVRADWQSLRAEPETPAFVREAIDEHLQGIQL
jgi:serine/threonine-protein kinase HipA